MQAFENRLKLLIPTLFTILFCIFKYICIVYIKCKMSRDLVYQNVNNKLHFNFLLGALCHYPTPCTL